MKARWDRYVIATWEGLELRGHLEEVVDHEALFAKSAGEVLKEVLHAQVRFVL